VATRGLEFRRRRRNLIIIIFFFIFVLLVGAAARARGRHGALRQGPLCDVDAAAACHSAHGQECVCALPRGDDGAELQQELVRVRPDRVRDWWRKNSDFSEYFLCDFLRFDFLLNLVHHIDSDYFGVGYNITPSQVFGGQRHRALRPLASRRRRFFIVVIGSSFTVGDGSCCIVIRIVCRCHHRLILCNCSCFGCSARLWHAAQRGVV
jgi:hypothetical protein